MEIKLDESQPAFSEIDAIFLMKQLLAANTEVVKQTNRPAWSYQKRRKRTKANH